MSFTHSKILPFLVPRLQSVLQLSAIINRRRNRSPSQSINECPGWGHHEVFIIHFFIRKSAAEYWSRTKSDQLKAPRFTSLADWCSAPTGEEVRSEWVVMIVMMGKFAIQLSLLGWLRLRGSFDIAFCYKVRLNQLTLVHYPPQPSLRKNRLTYIWYGHWSCKGPFLP